MALAWIVYAANYLFSSRAASWIGPPDYAIALNLNRLGRGCAVGVLGLLLASWWVPGFSELDLALGGVREQDQFRLVSQRTAGLVERYGPRARLLNLSDRMEVAMGRIPSDPLPWGDADDLEKRLAVSPLPLELWLASSGPPQAMERKLKPLQSQVVQAGYHCEQIANDLSHARLLRCRFQAMGRSE